MPNSQWERMRRLGASLFVLVLVFGFAIDTMPPICEAQLVLKERVDGILDASGLWQGMWTLFGPNPDSENGRITAVVSYSDGSRVDWQAPDWGKTSNLDRVILFREMEYYDSITYNANKPLLPYFARHITEQTRPEFNPQARPISIEISRHAAYIPPPEPGKMMPVNGDWSEFKTYPVYSAWF